MLIRFYTSNITFEITINCLVLFAVLKGRLLFRGVSFVSCMENDSVNTVVSILAAKYFCLYPIRVFYRNGQLYATNSRRVFDTVRISSGCCFFLDLFTAF